VEQLTGAVKGLAASYLSIQGFNLTGGLVRDAARFQALGPQLEQVTGSVQQSQQAMALLSKTAADTGIGYEQLGKTFLGTAIAAKGSNIEVNKALTVQARLAEIGTKLGSSTEEINRSQVAFQQILGKGKISTEELRQQLGEALPVALGIFQKASGLSFADFNAKLEKGKLSLADFPNLFRELGKAAGDLDSPFTKVIEKQNQINDRFNKLKLTVGVGLTPVFEKLLGGLEKLTKFTTDNLGALTKTAIALGVVATGWLAVTAAAKAAALAQGTAAAIGAAPGGFWGKLLVGGAAAAGLVAFRKQINDALFGGIDEGVKAAQDAIKQLTSGKLPNVSGGLTGPGYVEPVDEADAKRRRSAIDKAYRQELETQRNITSEQGKQLEIKARTEMIGMSEYQVLNRRFELEKQLFGQREREIGMSGVDPRLAQAQSATSYRELQAATAQIRQDFQDLLDAGRGLGVEAQQLLEPFADIFNPAQAVESPYEQAFRGLKDNIDKAIKGFDDLDAQIKKSFAGAEGDPEIQALLDPIRNARKKIDELKDPKIQGIAVSDALSKGDRDSLNGRIREQQVLLKANGGELKEMDKLLVKYGEDWKKLDPTIKGVLTDQAKMIDKNNELLQQQGRQRDLVQSIGQTMAEGIGSAITGLIQGTQTLNDVLSQTLNQIGQILLQSSITKLLGGIKIGGIPLLAEGGPLAGGQAAVVGEEGPELFIPRTPGTIVPTDMAVPYLQGAATINPDGSTTYAASYPGAPGAAGAAGRAGAGVAGAPGRAGAMGLTVPFLKAPAGAAGVTPQAMAEATAAAMAGMGAIDIRYETVNVGGMDVVTNEQAQAIGRDSATRGAQIALAAIQNSVGTRRKLGM
jgi:tape measure domain-containing protein